MDVLALVMLILLGIMVLPLVAVVRTLAHPLPRARHRRRTA